MLKKLFSVFMGVVVLFGTLAFNPAQKVSAASYVSKLPKTVATTGVVVLDITKDKGASDNQASAEALLAIRTIQGLVNRTSSTKIYLTHDQLAWCDVWNPPDVDTMNLTDGLVPVTKTYPTLDNNKQFPVLSYLLENYSSYIAGEVKIQSGAGESGPVMAALTACAQLNAIPVTPNIKTYVANEGLNLSVLADTTGMTDDVTAFNWAYNNYFNSSTTRAYIGKFSFNDWGANGAAINYDPLDYYIATKAFIMDLNANNQAESNAEATLLNSNNYAPGVPVLGSADDEGAEISRITQLGYTFSFFDGPNFSVHSSFPSDPSAITASTPTAPSTIDNSGAYVAFYVTDGDAFGISQFLHRDYWRNSPKAGQVPIGWSISPMVFDLFPNLISYYSSHNYNNNYELIANYNDGSYPGTLAGVNNYLATYKSYLDNTNGAFKMMNYFDLGPNAEYNVSVLNPYGCIFGYQGNTDGNAVLFRTLNSNSVVRYKYVRSNTEYLRNGDI